MYVEVFCKVPDQSSCGHYHYSQWNSPKKKGAVEVQGSTGTKNDSTTEKGHKLMGGLAPAESSTPLYSPLALTLILFDWLLAVLLFVS